MGQAVPTQNPAVVLRSHFNQLRVLLVAALLTVIGLTATVVILATDEEPAGSISSAQPVGHIKYGGFNPASGRPHAAPLPKPEPSAPSVSRLQGGAHEGTRGPVRDYSMNSATGEYGSTLAPSPKTRYDGGPEEGSRGPGFNTH